jgi:hypothetical protein
MLYELVSGKPPWKGESITELALRVAMDPMPPLVGMSPFDAVVGRCLEKEPARRYGNIAELAAALAPFAGPRGGDLATAVARVLRGSQVAIGQPNVTQQSTPTTLRGASGVMVSSTAQTSRRSWKVPAVIGLGAAGGIIAVVLATTGTNVDSGSHVQAPAAAPVAPVDPPKPAEAVKPPEPAKPVDTAPAKVDPMTVSVPKTEPKTEPKPDTKPADDKHKKHHATPTTPTTTPKPPEDVGDSRT